MPYKQRKVIRKGQIQVLTKVQDVIGESKRAPSRIKRLSEDHHILCNVPQYHNNITRRGPNWLQMIPTRLFIFITAVSWYPYKNGELFYMVCALIDGLNPCLSQGSGRCSDVTISQDCIDTRVDLKCGRYGAWNCGVIFLEDTEIPARFYYELTRFIRYQNNIKTKKEIYR